MGGICYHVLNRGNAREKVFHKKEDYAAFLDLVEEAGERLASGTEWLACKNYGIQSTPANNPGQVGSPVFSAVAIMRCFSLNTMVSFGSRCV